MKNESEWLLESLLLRIKSKSAYEHLKNNNILSLPEKITLREMISGMSCDYEFKEFAFDCIERNLKGKSPQEKFGSLVWDKISITHDIQFSEQTFQFEGWVNLEDNTEDKEDEFSSDSEDAGSPSLADHALVTHLRDAQTKT